MCPSATSTRAFLNSPTKPCFQCDRYPYPIFYLYPPQGYIYVEAEKESHVMDAISGLRTIYRGKGAQKVPLNEMVAAISVSGTQVVPFDQHGSAFESCCSMKWLQPSR